jgi:hypothetical protein
VKTFACRWCPKLATGTWAGKGGTCAPNDTIYHCDEHEEQAWRLVKSCPERHSKLLEQLQGLF